ncbi:UDP-N-acetylmuramate--L-alanine ligase [Desertivirga arenae]|uniref:UDP-N-acetylmuramate--L-alanine ligase n=1 Tax=Desertivirga arenae TaxID=2810309 RepID=UPI001A96EB38|nr:UDP-N-acetylmuramate--L-alanine ligase [Pedobacter sp. SYSU D00823]
MELDNIEQVYLVGIGGIGMSGLARYFHKRGCEVIGYDRTQTTLTDSLAEEGMVITYVDGVDQIPANFKAASDNLLVIYTPAIPKDSAILNYFQENNFDLKKRSEVLGIISKGMFTIAVAGTHGKTTTSTLVAHILKHSGFDCTAFLGGISSNYDTNVLFGDNDVVVVEADEYDRSFLRLHPDIAIITSMDADHLDIYGDDSHVKESFRLFASQLKEGGKLIRKSGLPLEGGTNYSAKEVAEVCATNVRIEAGTFFFDFKGQDLEINDIELGLPGLHNVENATAAIQASLLLNIEAEKIKAALKDFRGVKRRFEYVIRTDEKVFIDDYAHHPEELRACLSAVKQLYPGRKLTVVFQPHLYSRTRDFVDGFAEVLDMADELVLLDIYPARELPIPGVTSEIIYNKMKLENKQISSKESAEAIIAKLQPELLLTVGAGDIDTLVLPFKEILENA